jgi:RNA polymerase sigma-70 factor (ECF subfamily)
VRVEHDDNQLIDEVLKGTTASFDVLVQRYHSRLFGLMYHFCGNREDAEDLTQETWVLAYRKLGQFAYASSFYTWLSRIAVNHMISRRRKKQMDRVMERIPLEADEHSDKAPDVDESLVANEKRALIQWGISQLEQDRRAVLILRDFDGLDYHQIAEIISVPIGTVRSRLHRARLDLHELLKDKIAEFV